MDKKKIKKHKSDDEMALKLVVSPIIEISQSDINRSFSFESQHLYVFEFYLGDVNVTPQSPTSIKYTVSKSNEFDGQRVVLKPIVRGDQEQENNFETFRNLNIKSLDDLLDNVFSENEYLNGEGSKENQIYDVGANLILPKININNEDYEIELTESPAFNTLSVPGSITVKG